MYSTQFSRLQCDPVQCMLNRWTGDATPEPGVSHVLGGGGLEVVAGRASQQARRKRLPSVLTEAGMLQVGAEDAAFERRQDGAAGRSADIYLEVRQVPRTQVVLTAGCLRLPSDMFRANPSRLTLSPKGPSE